MKSLSARTEPTRGLPRIIFKLRTEGLGWIAKRLSHEANQPSTHVGQTLHSLVRRSIAAAALLPRHMRRSLNSESDEASETLFAFYDLKISPITFDFLWFLVAADLYRRRRGLRNVHVVVVPGPQAGVRNESEDYESVVDQDERRNRIRNILMQACATLPNLAGLTVAASRHEATTFRSDLAHHVYPVGYETALPHHVSSRVCLDAARRGEGPIAVLRATTDMLERADRWLADHAKGRKVVTITLRNYGYMTVRNSNSEAWAAFARSLDPARYIPVIVPDVEETIKGLSKAFDGLAAYPDAARTVGLRMALYERAYLNLGVNTGPMGLCWLNERTRYATFKMAPQGVPQTTATYFRELGFEPDRSLPFAKPAQRLVWVDDTFERINAVFTEMVALIESEPPTLRGGH